jgi:hypothetical protein
VNGLTPHRVLEKLIYVGMGNIAELFGVGGNLRPILFARPMAYQVSRRVLEMILSLKEKGGTTTWWPP